MAKVLIEKLKEAEIIKFGDFTLKSGKKSNVYFNSKHLISYPNLLKEISYEMGKLMDYNEISVVAGVPMGAIPFATTISTIYNIPMIMVRETRKKYGMQNLIEGNFKNKECILIEDVITTGQSVINTINNLEKENLKIKEIIVIIDRQNGGVDNLIQLGYTVKSLFKMDDFFQNNEYTPLKSNAVTKNLLKIVTKKQSNLILAADIDDPKKILHITSLIGNMICGIKLHIDIINFHDISFEQFFEKLLLLKEKFGFVIIEDRKYSDIGKIALKQLSKIINVVDIVTAHCITGETMIKQLDDTGVGLLLIHKLSTEDNLIDDVYSKKVEDIARKCDNCLGFISQTRVDNEFLTFAPGVNTNLSYDNQGQTYKTPEYLAERGVNFFIVGRGIYEDFNMDNLVELKTRCWNTWYL